MYIRDAKCMANEGACLKCGAPLSDDAQLGFCPDCLFGQAAKFVPATSEADSDEPLPRRFGDYELIEEIARGGMGVVYRARQRSLGRTVAVKMLLGGWLVSAQSGRRFQAEAEAIAALSHPNIVQIHDVGVIAGQDYFSMEYVEGESLAGLLARGPIPARTAARYLKTIAEAIHYAHGQGILHRDLKPSNVLIDSRDEPRITDFGLAHRLDGDLELTMTGQVLGSPNYMPPEQAGARKGKVGPQSDVYSLGAMLYHLVTGRPPFVGEGLSDTLAQVLQDSPASLRLFNPTLPRDLETLCLKCLEKEPEKRYPTAQSLAEDLGRFLRGEGIHARPINRLEKARRWCVRKPAMAAVISLAALLVATLVAGSVLLMLRSQREREQIYQASMNLARQAWEENNVGRIRELLTASRDSPHRGFEWDYWQRQTHWAEKTFDRQADIAIAVAFSPDGGRVLAGFLNQTAKAWDLGSQRELVILKSADKPATGGESQQPAAFSFDAAILAVGGPDHSVRLLETSSGRELGRLTGTTSHVESIAFSNDGHWLAAGSDQGNVIVWDTRTRSRIAGWNAHNGIVIAVAFSPDGRHLATGGMDSSAKVWDVPSGKEIFSIRHADQLYGLAFFPDGRKFITGSRDQTAKIWDLERPEPLHVLDHLQGVEAVAVSPDGSQILTGSSDQTVKLWDGVTGRLLREFKGHSQPIVALAFARDGQRIATGSGDKSVKVWNLASPENPLKLQGHTNAIWSAAFSPSGERIVTGGWDAKAMLWDAAMTHNAKCLAMTPEPIVMARFSPDGKRLAAVGWHGMAKILDAESGVELLQLAGHTNSVLSVAFSPTGDRLATSSYDHTARIWSGRDGTLLQTLIGHSDRVNSVAFSPDGRRILTASYDETARIWDAASGAALLKIAPQTGELYAAAFSPDGRWIVTGGDNAAAEIREASTGRLRCALRGHSNLIAAVAFSPDGQRVVTGSWDLTAKVWETRHGREMLTLKGHTGPVLSVAFSPDGRSILTAGYDQTVRIWQAATAQQIAAWEKEDVAGR
jgi:eukaryotic-like serine/threonine-protein kinase